MTNSLQVFNNELGQIRTLEIEGKIWFVASDVAKALGYTNPRKAILDHCKGVTKRDILTDGGAQLINIIPEGDVYRLVGRSKLPSAEKFESWVFDEVLPSLRQTGSYSNVPKPLDSYQIEDPIERALKWVEEEQQRRLLQSEVEQKQTELEYQEPFVDLAKKRFSLVGHYTITEVTKSLDLKRGVIIKFAREKGFIHKTRPEVNKSGEKYFKVYSSGQFNSIGITEEGLQMLSEEFGW